MSSGSKYRKPSAAQNLTTCPECSRTVGAVLDTYNAVTSDDFGRRTTWRTTPHHRLDTRVRCVGSRIVIPAEVVYSRKDKELV